MEYFPFFIDIEGKDALIAGGGTVALRKAEKLLPFSPRLRVVAPEICKRLRALEGIALETREFEDADIEGCLFVIAATDSREQNRHISELCRSRGIMVNVVDDRENCGFVFPALVKRGALTVGVSTGGASPTAAIWLKEKISELLPENLEAVLSRLEAERRSLRETEPDEARRAELLKARFIELLK